MRREKPSWFGLSVLVGVAVGALLLLTVYLWRATEERRADRRGEALVQAAVAAPPPAVATAPYRFDRPVARFELPPDLVEISGLTVLDDGSIGAVQDEEGALYVLDPESGEVTAVVPFGPPGDYEGVELVGDRLFVLRADGALFEMAGWSGGDASGREVALDLPRDCDAEGLGYDAGRGHLLVACKEEGGPGLGERKAVYAYGLEARALRDGPAFVIDPAEVPGDRKLKPSAVAVHPVTGAAVVLSSVREAVVVVGDGGAVTDVWSWAEAGFEQPEGLAFLPNGDLLIASEGGEQPAVLARFAYEPR